MLLGGVVSEWLRLTNLVQIPFMPRKGPFLIYYQKPESLKYPMVDMIDNVAITGWRWRRAKCESRHCHNRRHR